MFCTVVLEPGDPLFKVLVTHDLATTLRVGPAYVTVSIQRSPVPTYIKISGRLESIAPLLKHVLLFQGRLTTTHSIAIDALAVAIRQEQDRLCRVMSNRPLEE
jgi:type IV secretory pathway protease TraF